MKSKNHVAEIRSMDFKTNTSIAAVAAYIYQSYDLNRAVYMSDCKPLTLGFSPRIRNLENFLEMLKTRFPIT